MGTGLAGIHSAGHRVKWDHPLASQELGSPGSDQAGPTSPRPCPHPGLPQPLLHRKDLSSSQPLTETAPTNLHVPPSQLGRPVGSDTTGLAPCLNAHPNEGPPRSQPLFSHYPQPPPPQYPQSGSYTQPPPDYLPSEARPGLDFESPTHSTGHLKAQLVCNYVQSQQELLWEGGGVTETLWL